MNLEQTAGWWESKPTTVLCETNDSIVNARGVRFWSGRIEARTGLRMMPTFPRSSLSFRTAGFPQYGWKAGLSGGAFPNATQLKSAPDIRCLSSGLHPPFVHLVVTTVVPHCVGPWTR